MNGLGYEGDDGWVIEIETFMARGHLYINPALSTKSKTLKNIRIQLPAK